MRWNKVYAIFKKEIRELVRDKKTLFVMFALPLIIYPLLIMGISMVMINVQNGYETSEYVVGIDGSVSDTKLIDSLNSAGRDDSATDKANAADAVDSTTDKAYAADKSDSVSFKTVQCDDYKQALSDGTVDAYLTFSDDTYQIFYNSSDTDSGYAADYLQDTLETYKEGISLELFKEANLDADKFMNPIKLIKEDLASDEQSMGSVLGMIVPLLLIMGVFVGTMTPAIDATSGEKERGTQETLMSFPISSHELICGKYLAVSAAGVLSAFLYLISIGILAGYIYALAGMGAGMTISLGKFVPSLLVVIMSTIALALFLGAFIMCVCSFAKSTKEASSYISPVMVVIMLIAYAGYLDVHLTVSLSVVPILNIVLLIKSVLAFEYNTLAIVLVLVSNIAYAVIAITVLGKLYTSERILFGESFGSLFERRNQRQKGTVPTIGDAILVLSITAVLFLYVGSILQLKLLLIGLALSHIIIVGMPILAAWYGKIDFKRTFSLNNFGMKNLPAIIITAIGAFIVGNIACMPISNIVNDSMSTYSDGMSTLMSSQSIWVVWFVIGVVPAISEETLFRGYLLSSLRQKTKPIVYIIVTALIFGIYHMNLYQGCYAFLLGLVLAYVVYKTNSIFASAIIHFICNSMAVILSMTTIINLEKISDIQLIGIGIAGLVMLVAGLWFISRKKNEVTADV